MQHHRLGTWSIEQQKSRDTVAGSQTCMMYFIRDERRRRQSCSKGETLCLTLTVEQNLYSVVELCRGAAGRKSGQWIIIVGWYAYAWSVATRYTLYICKCFRTFHNFIHAHKNLPKIEKQNKTWQQLPQIQDLSVQYVGLCICLWLQKNERWWCNNKLQNTAAAGLQTGCNCSIHMILTQLACTYTHAIANTLYFFSLPTSCFTRLPHLAQPNQAQVPAPMQLL